MSETVVVGKLREPYTIETAEGETVPIEGWQQRAMWSYLRLVQGRSIDNEIKKASEQMKAMATPVDSYVVLEELLGESILAGKQRELQFIMDNGEVLAVATTKHLLISPAKVYETAQKILGVPLSSHKGLNGGQVLFDGWAGIKTGAQIDGGSITTRFAIRVSVFARVEMCFNPLSWLGVSGLGRFGLAGGYERVLRIQKITELEPRLKSAIENAKGRLGDLQKRVEKTKAVPLSSSTATILTGGMGMAYGLGEKTIRQVLDRYSEEDQTQWGLAMAQSWTAEHGKTRKTPEGQETRTKQSLSTISGATLLIDDIKDAEEKCRKWLGGQKSKLAEDLLKGRLP
jgi:hypothetical protein